MESLRSHVTVFDHESSGELKFPDATEPFIPPHSLVLKGVEIHTDLAIFIPDHCRRESLGSR
jgi:hypothetical protein